MKLHISNILSSIIIITVTAVVIFPLYIIFYVEPSFNQFIINNTENDAAKLGQHLSHSFFTKHRPVNRASLTPETLKAFSKVKNDFHIIKIKLFDAKGEILHSSDVRDIGTVNTREYFHTVVAKGQLYTKTVHKDKSSLEGKTMPVDVVEVYVPIMHDETFAGAFEIYYDITEKRSQLAFHINQITISTLMISVLLLGAVVWAIIQASKNIQAREFAEQKLMDAYEDLELRVSERTKELTKVNEALEKEITVRQKTEKENKLLIDELRAAINKVKTLSGLLPICSSCQQIRDAEGKWSKVDEYIQKRTDAEFTHGICPTCAKKLYPDLYDDLDI
nr:hypothetical protein [Desulfobulbaceae bacterium]